jgi:uncharacterized protein HemX
MNTSKTQTAFVVLSIVAVVACLSVAVLGYHNHQVTVQARQTSEVQQAQATLKQHDAVAATNQKNAADRIISLTNQKNSLCAVLKANPRVVYNVALCQ